MNNIGENEIDMRSVGLYIGRAKAARKLKEMCKLQTKVEIILVKKVAYNPIQWNVTEPGPRPLRPYLNKINNNNCVSFKLLLIVEAEI